MQDSMNLTIKFLGKFIKIVETIKIKYETSEIIRTFEHFGVGSIIGWPFIIRGINSDNPSVKYIHIGNHVSIGSGSTIFATKAHCYIGDRTFSGPHMTIMTGDHPFDIKGKYMVDCRKKDLQRKGFDVSKYDKNVMIEEDVWIGCNVTVLKGVTIGRGAIVGGVAW